MVKLVSTSSTMEEQDELVQAIDKVMVKTRGFLEESMMFEDRLFQQLSGTGLLISTIVQHSKEWFFQRKGRLTSSYFGTVCGVNNYAGPHHLWELMTNRVDDPFRGNEHTDRGNRLEPVALKWYIKHACEQDHIKVSTTGLWIFKDKPFLGASPDALVGEDGLLEIKCPKYKPHESIPSNYLCQIQGQLWITGRDWCDFLSYTQDKGITLFRVQKSQAFWDWMYPQLEKFYLFVTIDEPPEMGFELDYEKRSKHALSLCNITEKKICT